MKFFALQVNLLSLGYSSFHEDIEKRRYSLSIFEKNKKNRIFNIHSICDHFDHLFSVSCGYILNFMPDLIIPRMFL